ncbi:MAG: agmatinase [Bacillota bacterium]
MQKANLAFTGIPTFGRASLKDVTERWHAHAAVLGVPYDAGTGFRPGARFGPRSIREMSMRFPFFDPQDGYRGYYNPDLSRHFLKGIKVVDCGDVDIIYLDLDRNYSQIQGVVEAIRQHGSLPIILGGDHSITFPVLRAFHGGPELCIVHFDAHLDYRDSYMGVTLSHGSPMRRCSELPYVTSIVSLGIRGLRVVESDLMDALLSKSKVVTYRQYLARGPDLFYAALPEQGTPCYVTIDIDVLDPSLCPGTGTPEPDGLSLYELCDLLRGVAGRLRIVGFDLVEVNPLFDPGGLTSLASSQIIMEFLGAIFEKHSCNDVR